MKLKLIAIILIILAIAGYTKSITNSNTNSVNTFKTQGTMSKI